MWGVCLKGCDLINRSISVGITFSALAKSSNLLNTSSVAKLTSYPQLILFLNASSARDQSCLIGGKITYQRQERGSFWPQGPEQGVWDRNQGPLPPTSPFYHADRICVPAHFSFPRPATLFQGHIPVSSHLSHQPKR